MPVIPLNTLRETLATAKARWTAKSTPLDALTDQERRARLGVIVNESDRQSAMQRAAAPAPGEAGAFAPSVDWRNRNGRNYVTPVKDQGNCGSCVSFCTVATTEAMALIQHDQTLDLSEADAHFCSSHGANCNGWWPSDALGQLQSRGVADEACCPYHLPAACAPCADRNARAVKVGNWTTAASAADRKTWLTNTGPMCAVFDVYTDFFSYGTGVYHHVTGGLAGSHCVEVVGYDDAGKFWICKNSWGTAWGQQGFFCIGYGECGIETYPMWGVGSVVLPTPPRGWRHNDLVAAAAAPAAASDPSGYTWDADKTQHVVYRGTDAHVHELWFNGAWHHNDLTVAGAGTPAAGKPCGYTWDVDKTQHVVCRGTDAHIHELFFNGAWHHNDLTAAAQAPGAAGDPAGYTWSVDRTQHVVYRGADSHIHELFFNGAWHHNDLVAAAAAPAAAGDPAGYTWDVDKTQHVVYRGADAHVHELFFNGAWHHNDLTAAGAGAPAAGRPDGYTWNVDRTEHAVCRGGDAHIHELWFNGSWHHNDLTAAAAAPGAAGDPAGYTWDVDKTEHVVYRGTDGHIHELWL